MIDINIKNYNSIINQINQKNNDIIKYNDLIRYTRDTNKAITYDTDKVQTSNLSDVTYQAVEKIIDIYAKQIAEWENKLQNLFNQKNEIESMLDRLDSTERKIIELKYIKNLKWYQVAMKVGYSERQCKRINKRILEKMSRNVLFFLL